MALRIAIHVPRREFAVDVDICARSPLALTGSSGSGKSTILRAVAGLETETRGSLVADGVVWQDNEKFTPAATRRVGYLAQLNGLYPHLSASQNVEYPLLADGAGRAARRNTAADLLAQLGLHGCASRSVRELSGGQCRRVALARALAAERSVYLLDEPFAGLDEDAADAAEEFIAFRLAFFGKPALIAGHDRERLQRICGETVQVTRGRVFAEPAFEISDSAERAHVSALARSPRSIVRTPADCRGSSL